VTTPKLPVLGRRVGDLLPDRARLDAGDPGRWVDTYSPHAAGLDQDRVGQRAERRGVVAGALRGDPQAVVAGVLDGGDDVLW
jgi:hypothetical protein